MQVSPTVTTRTEPQHAWLSGLNIKNKSTINIEQRGFITEKSHIDQNHKSKLSRLSFGEKITVALSAILYSTGNAQEAFDHKNNFSSNGIFMKLLNSVFPFLISNLSGCVNMLNNTNERQELLRQYQHKKDSLSKEILFNRFQLMIKIGFRAAFSEKPEIAQTLEPELIDFITQLYFSGKNLASMNDQLKEKFSSLQGNHANTQRHLQKFLLVLLALTAVTIVNFSAYFIQSKSTYAITGIIAGALIALIMLASHFLEHSTYFSFAVKKQATDTLEVIDDIEKTSKKIMEGVSSQISPEEKKYLDERLKQLTQQEASILLTNPAGHLVLAAPPSTTGTQEIAWRFFKNIGHQVGEKVWVNAKQDYQDKLHKLTNTFNSIRQILQAQESDILNLAPDFQENMAFILDPSINLELRVNVIIQKLNTVLHYISNLNINVSDMLEQPIKDFGEIATSFQKSQKEYNDASRNMTYLQQSTIGVTL